MSANSSYSASFRDALLGGLDCSFDGWCGQNCYDFTDERQKITDLSACALLGGLGLLCAITSTSTASQTPRFKEWTRSTILVLFSFVFGMEVMLKCIQKDMIFLLQECHVLSALYIFILCVLPFKSFQSISKNLVETVAPMSYGPIGALIYPATYARTAPLSHFSYNTQHVFLILTPIYLLTAFPDVVRPFNVNAIAKSYTFKMIFSAFSLLVSVATSANINLTLCPFSTFPLQTKNYRLHLITACIFLHTFTWILYQFIAQLFKSNKPKSSWVYERWSCPSSYWHLLIVQ